MYMLPCMKVMSLMPKVALSTVITSVVVKNVVVKKKLLSLADREESISSWG